MGIRGHKVPPHRAAVLFDRHHPHSVSVQCEHPAALRSSAAGSFQAVTPLPPQAPSEESRPSTPRYGFAVVIPGRYSSRPYKSPPAKVASCFRAAKLPGNFATFLSPARKAFRASRTWPSRPLAQRVSVSPVLDAGPCLLQPGIISPYQGSAASEGYPRNHRYQAGLPPAVPVTIPGLPATPCAVPPASAT